MAHDTIFRIFSMTKPIVSVGIMMLVEDGHFLLADPVAKFIPEFAEPEGRRREQRQARTGAGAAADDHPGSAAPHLGPDLRPHRQRPGAAALQGVAAAQPQDHQCRARRAGRRAAADLPARRGMELQPLHRHPRPHHRSRQRQVARRLPHRAHPGAAADDRDRLLHRPKRMPAGSPKPSRPIPGPARRSRSSTCWRGLRWNPAAAGWCRPRWTMPASRRCCSTAARSTATGSSAARRWS